jgi:hypothetical protein
LSRNLFLLFNHQITAEQRRDAETTLLVGAIIEPPQELRHLWKNIPPDKEWISSCLAPIQDWLCQKSRKGDYLLVQGDFGATYLMVRFGLEIGTIPIYSTTERQAVEQHGPDGRVDLLHTFKHCRFRRYGD